MMNPTVRPDATLIEFLAARARAASDGRLVLDVLGGTVAALGLSVWRPVGWIGLASLALALAAFGLWGIIDRELRDRAASGPPVVVRLLAIARAVVVALGFCCVIGPLFLGLGVVLGTWIS
jgi:hypothetical protein